jgi:hypothetical protein
VDNRGGVLCNPLYLEQPPNAMATRTSVVEVTYEDPKTGQRWREREIRELPDDEFALVRKQAYDDFLAPVPRPDNDRELVRRPSRGDYLDVDNAPRRRRSARRRSPSTSSSSESDSGDSRRDRRRRGRGHQRARSEQGPIEKLKDKVDDSEGYLWYSCKPRKDCNIIERNFDSSYDGLIAAAAGGLIGAMTARRFGGYDHYTEDDRKKNRWKTIAGGVAGAAAFNLAENHFRVYTEERAEAKKEEREERRERRDNAAT